MKRLDYLSKPFNWIVKTKGGSLCTNCESHHPDHFLSLKKKTGMGHWDYDVKLYQCPSCRNWYPGKNKVSSEYGGCLLTYFHLVKIEYWDQPVVRTYYVEKRWDGSSRYNLTEIARDYIYDKKRETIYIRRNPLSAIGYIIIDNNKWREATRGMKRFEFERQVLDDANLRKTKFKYFPLTKVSRYHEKNRKHFDIPRTLLEYRGEWEIYAKFGLEHLIGLRGYEYLKPFFKKENIKKYLNKIKRFRLMPNEMHLLGKCKTKKEFDVMSGVGNRIFNVIQQNCNIETATNYILKINGNRNFRLLQLWYDYLIMRDDYDRNMTKYPKKLEAKHNELLQLNEMGESKGLDQRIKENYQQNVVFIYQNDMFILEPFKSTKEIIEEGKKLNHCVSQKHYMENYAYRNEVLLKLRRIDEFEKPYVTVEIKNGKIVQAFGKNNSIPDDFVKDFLSKYKKEVLVKTI